MTTVYRDRDGIMILRGLARGKTWPDAWQAPSPTRKSLKYMAPPNKYAGGDTSMAPYVRGD